MTEPVTERRIIRDPVSGGYAVDAEGKPVWPVQPDLPALVAPEQVYTEPPADAVYWSRAAKAQAEGWVVPLPAIDECIRIREAFHAAVERIKTRRQPDHRRLAATVYGAADLLAPDPVGAIVDAITDVAVDDWLTRNLAVAWSDLNAISYKLEEYWLSLLHRHQRAILQSLIGRESPSCNELRAHVESMSMAIEAPKPGRLTHVIY
ncbi:MAG TPA: hypothetical protein VGK16_02040 [Candidatus Limnocylindrales bacterium]|jgi:hypothetical protein